MCLHAAYPPPPLLLPLHQCTSSDVSCVVMLSSVSVEVCYALLTVIHLSMSSKLPSSFPCLLWGIACCLSALGKETEGEKLGERDMTIKPQWIVFPAFLRTVSLVMAEG